MMSPAAAGIHHHGQQIHLAGGGGGESHAVIPQYTSSAAGDGIQIWQNAQAAAASTNPNPIGVVAAYLKKPVPMLDARVLVGAGGGSAPTCQDCGNQAKKDCGHRRCRTCCKSRGYHCSTHVKSTWVPAARRRERQIAAAAAIVAAPKKPRLVSSNTTTTTTSLTSTPRRSSDSISSHQDAAGSFRESLPGNVRAPAVFKCVRVTPVDNGEDEFAYQAMVRIGGHLFKGFLYDQGEDEQRGGGGVGPSFSELHLGGNGPAADVPPPDVFGGNGASGSGGGGVLLGGGSVFGNQISQDDRS